MYSYSNKPARYRELFSPRAFADHLPQLWCVYEFTTTIQNPFRGFNPVLSMPWLVQHRFSRYKEPALSSYDPKWPLFKVLPFANNHSFIMALSESSYGMIISFGIKLSHTAGQLKSSWLDIKPVQIYSFIGQVPEFPFASGQYTAVQSNLWKFTEDVSNLRIPCYKDSFFAMLPCWCHRHMSPLQTSGNFSCARFEM